MGGVKEAFLEAADSLFQDFKNKLQVLSSIKALQLSRSTVTQRCEVVARGFDTAASERRCRFTDMTAKEELLSLLPMKERTRERTFLRHSKTTSSQCVKCVQY